MPARNSTRSKANYARKLRLAAHKVAYGTTYTVATNRFKVPRSSLHLIVKAHASGNYRAAENLAYHNNRGEVDQPL